MKLLDNAHIPHVIAKRRGAFQFAHAVDELGESRFILDNSSASGEWLCVAVNSYRHRGLLDVDAEYSSRARHQVAFIAMDPWQAVWTTKRTAVDPLPNIGPFLPSQSLSGWTEPFVDGLVNSATCLSHVVGLVRRLSGPKAIVVTALNEAGGRFAGRAAHVVAHCKLPC